PGAVGAIRPQLEAQRMRAADVRREQSSLRRREPADCAGKPGEGERERGKDDDAGKEREAHVGAKAVESPAGVAGVLPAALEHAQRRPEEGGDGGSPDDLVYDRHGESDDLQQGERRDDREPDEKGFAGRRQGNCRSQRESLTLTLTLTWSLTLTATATWK